jgi:uncharacterized damage-inducible protein DinB
MAMGYGPSTMDLLHQQYQLVKSSRGVALNFIEEQTGPDWLTPVEAFNGSNIRYLLVHTANTYLHWLSYFALKHEVTFADETDFTSIATIRRLYARVDDTVDAFLANYSGKLAGPVSGTLSRNRFVSATPLQLFTHVITHEFHHKGQVMTMCRLLGYAPPDTDVIRF